MSTTNPETIRVPSVSDHPAVKAASDKLAPLEADKRRIEARLNNLRWGAGRDDSQDRKREVAEKVLRGANVDDIRRDAAMEAATEIRLRTDLAILTEAIRIGETERDRAIGLAKSEISKSIVPAQHALARRAAIAWIQWLRLQQELDLFNEGLSEQGLLGDERMVTDLPRVVNGPRLDQPGSVIAWRLRILIDKGIFDERKDAELLAGLAVDPKPAPPPPKPVPAPPRVKTRSALGRLLESYGAL